MKKTITLTFLWIYTTISFSQNSSDTLYHYNFKLVNIDNVADAKYATNDLRVAIGEMLITFNDTSDTFLLKSHQYFIEEDLFVIIENAGFQIED